MYKIHPFFVRRAAPTPNQPRCIADYTSTSESGSSFSEASDSFTMGLPLDSPHSPLDMRSAAAQSSPIPSTRAMPTPAPVPAPAPEDSAGRRAQRLIAAMRARKAARMASTANPSMDAEEIAEAIAGLSLDKAVTASTLARARGMSAVRADSDVFTEGKTVENAEEASGSTAASPPRSRSPRTRVEPSEQPYFSISRPLSGHFDRPPNVVYTRDAGEADDLVSCLRGPLGFDLEWPPPGIGPVLTRQNKDGSIKHYRAGKWDAHAKKYVWPQGRTAVVQIADARTVVVYHLPIDGVIGPGIKAVLNDPERLKLGVNINMDARKMHRDELIENTSGLLELSHIAHLIDHEIWTRSARLISLARLTQHYLGVPLDKSEGIREGAWSKDLNAEQIECTFPNR